MLRVSYYTDETSKSAQGSFDVETIISVNQQQVRILKHTPSSPQSCFFRMHLSPFTHCRISYRNFAQDTAAVLPDVGGRAVPVALVYVQVT